MIVAIITVYFPDVQQVENSKVISEQADRVFICDNSPNDNSLLFKNISNCTYNYFGKNLGISRAFNYIFNNNTFSDDDYIIFFDQDSKIETNHINSLITDFDKINSSMQNIACIGPLFFDESSNKINMSNKKISEVNQIITSSMLTKYYLLKNINFWNENLFLDLADWDLCWRWKKAGYKCYITGNVIMKHKLGEGIKKIGNFELKVGKPFREYYQNRDGLYLLKKDYVPLRMRIRFILNITVRNLLHIFFLDYKRERIKFILRAFKDNSRNYHGEL